VRVVGLDTPLAAAVGGRTAAKLADKLDLHTVGELLRYYPRRYGERGQLTDLAKLREGEKVTVLGRVVKISERLPKPPSKVRAITTVEVTDGSRTISCTFFNQRYLGSWLGPGTEAMFAGTVSRFRTTLQISSPQVMRLSTGSASDATDAIESFAGGIIPMYPLTEGMRQTDLQNTIKTVLDVLEPVPDPVPVELRATRGLADLDSALRDVHRPRSRQDLNRAIERLRYDEALSVQLVLARRREEAKRFPAEPCRPKNCLSGWYWRPRLRRSQQRHGSAGNNSGRRR